MRRDMSGPTPKRGMECDSPPTPESRHAAKRAMLSNSPATSWETAGRAPGPLSPVRECDDNSTEPEPETTGCVRGTTSGVQGRGRPRPRHRVGRLSCGQPRAHAAPSDATRARAACARGRSAVCSPSRSQGMMLPSTPTPKRPAGHDRDMFSIRRHKSPVPFPGSISFDVRAATGCTARGGSARAGASLMHAGVRAPMPRGAGSTRAGPELQQPEPGKPLAGLPRAQAPAAAHRVQRESLQPPRLCTGARAALAAEAVAFGLSTGPPENLVPAPRARSRPRPSRDTQPSRPRLARVARSRARRARGSRAK